MSGTVACLVGRKDRVFVDEYAHGCLHDGARLARGEDSRFRHNDLDDLERQLRACPPEQAKLIAVDGVYGMSGDLAPLPELVELKNRYGAQLLVDDAHGTGVLGENGRGTPEHFGVEDEIDLHGGTFAKSFGTFGGYIAGPERVIRYLRFQSPAYVLTKALPASIAAATIVTLDLIQREPERRLKLWENLHALRDGPEGGGSQHRQSARCGHVDLDARFPRAAGDPRTRDAVQHPRQPGPLPGSAVQHLDHPRYADGGAHPGRRRPRRRRARAKFTSASRSRMAR